MRRLRVAAGARFSAVDSQSWASENFPTRALPAAHQASAMASRSRWFVAVTALVLAGGVIFWSDIYREIGIRSAPAKREVATRSPAAIAADSVFWHTFHGGQYDSIQPAIEALTRAYLATPNDAMTAGHLGWLHIWRISEHSRLAKTPASITEDMALSRKFFEEAVQLDPTDARLLGFLASARMGEGTIEHDERLSRLGYFTMLKAIKAWPAFNYFTAGYVMSGQPGDSKLFHEALDWQWRNLDACTKAHVNRTTGDLSALMANVTDRRACLNTWIAPHNGEGFFLNMGDMLVKSGDWNLAQKIYADAKLLPEYGAWKFAPVLEDRIRDAQANVARFSGKDPDPRTGLMNSSAFSCMVCHQQ
jgi:hypothetical protein